MFYICIYNIIMLESTTYNAYRNTITVWTCYEAFRHEWRAVVTQMYGRKWEKAFSFNISYIYKRWYTAYERRKKIMVCWGNVSGSKPHRLLYYSKLFWYEKRKLHLRLNSDGLDEVGFKKNEFNKKTFHGDRSLKKKPFDDSSY